MQQVQVYDARAGLLCSRYRCIMQEQVFYAAGAGILCKSKSFMQQVQVYYARAGLLCNMYMSIMQERVFFCNRYRSYMHVLVLYAGACLKRTCRSCMLVHALVAPVGLVCWCMP